MKYVYFFDEGNKDMKETLGGKGANLAEMSSMGIPVPPGFTITTDVCAIYAETSQYPGDTQEQIDVNLQKLELKMGAKLGDPTNPLLVSVRSGAAASMPGMMDTVLNLGLNDQTIQGLIALSNNERFAYDAYRRFVQMFGDVVLGVEHHDFEHLLEKKKETRGVEYDTELTAQDLKELVQEYKSLVEQKTGQPFPEDPKTQLKLSINAVFGSWNNNRAVLYRKLNDLNHLKGTAVNVQAMVFGNMGETSGTGVFFTRNPSTGLKEFYGEYLMNAQGEDVVAGIRTPKPIAELQNNLPDVYNELVQTYTKVEQHYKDMQDMEFTIQNGKLYILQTRAGKRTAHAAVRIAVEMVQEGLIDEKTAVLRVDPSSLDQLLHKQIDALAKSKAEVLAKGLPASPGAAVGSVVFSAEKAEEIAKEGGKCVLVRVETSPEDLAGMNAAQGILTARGGMTSHAAVVARGMGKCCVAGCSDIKINYETKEFTTGTEIIREGDYITLDGSTGEVLKGQVPTKDPEMSGNFGTIMEWADKFRTLKVRTNADTPHDANKARSFGAEGIGLCRTEHMFFEGDRIKAVREMILAETLAQRESALAKILPMQQSDFEGLFTAMAGLPVTIRLLDPPLHEFLPTKQQDIQELATEMVVPFENLKQKVEDLHECNPMLGHRGCRLAITYPEILQMQVKAIIQAAINVQKSGQSVTPEIMIPLVGHVNELKTLKALAKKIADDLIAANQIEMKYLIGTMIEVPRAALTADEIAKEAEFFSFGTNDLTQMTFGYSRDDVGSFVPEYISQKILEKDPFAVLDQTGVGQLVRTAVQKGKQTRPDIKLGICGEHGGEPSSVEFCHKSGLDYVSCSPFRVPIARLAAAHATLK